MHVKAVPKCSRTKQISIFTCISIRIPMLLRKSIRKLLPLTQVHVLVIFAIRSSNRDLHSTIISKYFEEQTTLVLMVLISCPLAYRESIWETNRWNANIVTKHFRTNRRWNSICERIRERGLTNATNVPVPLNSNSTWRPIWLFTRVIISVELVFIWLSQL